MPSSPHRQPLDPPGSRRPGHGAPVAGGVPVEVHDASGAPVTVSSRTGGRDWAWAAAIFLLALGVRIAYLAEVVRGPLFLLNTARGTDMWGFDQWARHLAGGGWMRQGAFYQAPLYPHLLGLLYWLAGPSQLVGVAANHLLGGLTCVVVFLIGRNLFGPAVGIVAGLLWALYTPMVFFEGFLLGTALETLVAATFALALTRVTGPAVGSAPRWFLAGIAGGLAAAARANFLVTIPLALALLMVDRHRLSWARAVTVGASYLAGAAAIVAPITAHNLITGGQLIPIASSGPITFWIGNSFDSTPIGFIYPQLGPMPLTSVAFWQHQAVKFLFFWYGLEPAQNVNYYVGLQFSRVLSALPVEFWMVAPPGLAGMILAATARRRVLPLHILFWPYTLSVVGFFVIARLRLPAVALLLPFAACALAWIWDAAKAGRRARAGAVAGLLLAVALLVRPWDTRITSREDVENRSAKGLRPLRALGHRYVRVQDIETLRNVTVNQARRFARAGDGGGFRAAHGLIGRYLAGLPRDAEVIALRGFLFQLQGESARAEGEYLRALAADEASAPAHYLLGKLYLTWGGNGRRALPHLERARALDPRGERFPDLEKILAEIGGRR